MAKEMKRGLAAEEKLIRTRDLDPPARILTAQDPRDEQTFFPKIMQTICRILGQTSGLPAFKRLLGCGDPSPKGSYRNKPNVTRGALVELTAR
jgi:hypothetical protein